MRSESLKIGREAELPRVSIESERQFQQVSLHVMSSNPFAELAKVRVPQDRKLPGYVYIVPLPRRWKKGPTISNSQFLTHVDMHMSQAKATSQEMNTCEFLEHSELEMVLRR
jgi:hypothetical protein